MRFFIYEIKMTRREKHPAKKGLNPVAGWPVMAEIYILVEIINR